MSEASLVISQKIDETFILTVFKDRRTRLIDIPLGTDAKAARKQAQDIIDAVRSAGELADKTA